MRGSLRRVPWARARTGFARAFEDLIARLAVKTDRSAFAELLRVAWRSVGKVRQRARADERKRGNVFAKLERIGVDEISYKRGHCSLTVVVNHEKGRLVWAGPGRDGDTLRRFVDELGPERTARIKLVGADAASWMIGVVRERCPTATQTRDPFQVVQRAARALDPCRRDVWNELRGRGELEQARNDKRSMWVLRKHPERLSSPQKQTLAAIERENQPLYRAYLLKETLRGASTASPSGARAQFAMWLSWAPRSRLEPSVKLAKTVRGHRERIEAAFDTGASNGLAESTNTRVRLLHRVAFGFHSAEPLVALTTFRLGGMCPPLPRERYPRIGQ
jgi:transposase